MKLDIIIGTSVYTPDATVIGIAFKGESDSVAFTKWASANSTFGRPNTVQALNSRPEADQIASLVAKWEEWSRKSGNPLTIKATPRKVANPF